MKRGKPLEQPTKRVSTHDALDDVLGQLADELPQVPQSVWAQFADAIRNAALKDMREEARGRFQPRFIPGRVD